MNDQFLSIRKNTAILKEYEYLNSLRTHVWCPNKQCVTQSTYELINRRHFTIFQAYGNILYSKYPAVLLACTAAAILNIMQHCKKALKLFILNVSGGECERRGLRVRLGGNSYPISAMSDVHHRYS